MVPVTILQSYQQGVAVWGEPGMAALWGAATKKVIGAGIDDPRHARDLATLVGQHDVPVISVSYGDGRASQQVSLRRQEILDAADIRALRAGLGPAPGHRRPARADQPAALVLRAASRPDHRGHRPGRGRHAARRPARPQPQPGPAAMPFQHREEIPS